MEEEVPVARSMYTANVHDTAHFEKRESIDEAQ